MLSDYHRLMAPWYDRDKSRANTRVAHTGERDARDREIAEAFGRSQSQLAEELLALIHAQAPAFFEDLVIDVLLAMGYGGRRRDLAMRLGRTGDGGVDGVISQDELGLDLIYVQAKRLKPGTVVPVGEVRDFAGSLDAHRASKGRMTELFANNRRVFGALDRKVTPYAWDKEVAPGVTAVGTPGHSIGHTSFIASSGGKTVYLQSDVCNNVAVFAPHPDWHGFFDQDPPQAAATRRRVYDMLLAEKLPVQGYHFPFPALARIEKQGDGYRVVPMASL